MWIAIQYVTSALSLLAFFAAAVTYGVSKRAEAARKLIETAPEQDRAELIRAQSEFFDVDTSALSPDQALEVILAQIRARAERYRIGAMVICALGLAFLAVTAYAISKTAPSQPPPSGISGTDTDRNLAFLIGYEGAIALAQSKMGRDITQSVAHLNEQLRLLKIPEIEFPARPMGEQNDAVPATRFSQAISGILSARSKELEDCFQLGWVGVIHTNTPELFPSFSLREYTKACGYDITKSIGSDSEIFEHLVEQAGDTAAH
jgi:hypothetical protein